MQIEGIERIHSKDFLAKRCQLEAIQVNVSLGIESNWSQLRIEISFVTKDSSCVRRF